MSLYQDISVINNFKGTKLENWAKRGLLEALAVLNWMGRERESPLKGDGALKIFPPTGIVVMAFHSCADTM